MFIIIFKYMRANIYIKYFVKNSEKNSENATIYCIKLEKNSESVVNINENNELDKEIINVSKEKIIYNFETEYCKLNELDKLNEKDVIEYCETKLNDIDTSVNNNNYPIELNHGFNFEVNDNELDQYKFYQVEHNDDYIYRLKNYYCILKFEREVLNNNLSKIDLPVINCKLTQSTLNQLDHFFNLNSNIFKIMMWNKANVFYSNSFEDIFVTNLIFFKTENIIQQFYILPNLNPVGVYLSDFRCKFFNSAENVNSTNATNTALVLHKDAAFINSAKNFVEELQKANDIEFSWIACYLLEARQMDENFIDRVAQRIDLDWKIKEEIIKKRRSDFIKKCKEITDYLQKKIIGDFKITSFISENEIMLRKRWNRQLKKKLNLQILIDQISYLSLV